jgi:hypothetical protein
MEKRSRGYFARGTPEESTVEKKTTKGPGCSNGIRNWFIIKRIILGIRGMSTRFSCRPQSCSSQSKYSGLPLECGK